MMKRWFTYLCLVAFVGASAFACKKQAAPVTEPEPVSETSPAPAGATAATPAAATAATTATTPAQ